jgi:putative transposase
MLTYKRKLILTKTQESRISSWIGACRVVYNLGLEIRIEAYKNLQKSVNKFELMKQLTDLKDIDWIKDVPAQTLQNSMDRLDISYKNFFRTCHKGGGFPRFAAKRNYKSIILKSVSVSENKIKLPKIGELRMFKDAPILGIPKTATIIKEPTGYFVCIVCDKISKTIQNPDESQVCGIDMGVTYFCVDNNGNLIENPKHFKKYERQLRVENRSLARKKKLSNRWKKQALIVGLLHHKIANIRKDFLHKESTKMAKKYHTVFVEDLKILNMTKSCKPKQDETGKFLRNGQAAKSGLNKSILDSGWGMFREMLSYKTNVVRINPKYTSQTCNECGVKDATSRISQSEFVCKHCGNLSNADHNAAKNILGKGIALNREREPVGCAWVLEPQML